MKKCFRYIALFLFIWGMQYTAQAQEVQKKSSQKNEFSFHGIVGIGTPPTAVMASSIPQNQRIAECSFFGGDSLDGFDFTRNESLAEFDGIRMYSEFRAFIFKKQAEFVKKKYNISALPFEIAAAGKVISPPVTLTSACTNSDFENGDFTGWVTARGYNANSNAPLTVMASPAYLNTTRMYTVVMI